MKKRNFKYIILIMLFLNGCVEKDHKIINKNLTNNKTISVESNITTLTFSPDSRILLSGKENGMVDVWDTKTKTRSHTLFVHKDKINKIAIHPKGHQFASVSKDGRMTIWDFDRKKQLCDLNIGKPIHTLVYSSDGKQIALSVVDEHKRILIVDSECKRIWTPDLNEKFNDLWKEVSGFRFIDLKLFDHNSIKFLSYLNENNNLLTYERGPMFQSEINLYNTKNGSLLKSVQRSGGMFGSYYDLVQLLPDEKRFLTAEYKGRVRIHRLKDGKVARKYLFCPGPFSISEPSTLKKLTISNEGKRAMALCNYDDLYLLNLENGDILGKVKDNSGEITKIVFAPNGKVFATGYKEGTIKIRSTRELFKTGKNQR